MKKVPAPLNLRALGCKQRKLREFYLIGIKAEKMKDFPTTGVTSLGSDLRPASCVLLVLKPPSTIHPLGSLGLGSHSTPTLPRSPRWNLCTRQPLRFPFLQQLRSHPFHLLIIGRTRYEGCCRSRRMDLNGDEL